MTRTVFWSWQSDLPADLTKNFIKSALDQALTKVSAELELHPADRIELDHDTKGEAGMVEIVKTIFEKIDECEVFVADVCPVAMTPKREGKPSKEVANPNVMIELGYALRELGHQRVIAVTNLAYGGRPEELPFDLRHRRGAIAYTLSHEDLPQRKKVLAKLVGQLVAALKINLEAPREDRRVKNPRPMLTLEFDDRQMPAVAHIKQTTTSDEAAIMDEIRKKTPVRSKTDRQMPGSALEVALQGIAYSGFGSRGREKPIKEWTQQELDGYNARVRAYYRSYESYLGESKEHRLLLQRAIVVSLAISNSGTKPATDLRVRLTFPPGVRAYESDALPSAPMPPKAPPLAPHGLSSMAEVVHLTPSYNSIFATLPRIADDRSNMELRRDSLQHQSTAGLSDFTLLLTTAEDIRSFDVVYSIHDNETPIAQTGKLRFEVALSERSLP